MTQSVDLNPFSACFKDTPGNRLRLAVSRDLAGIFSEALSLPLTAELKGLIEALDDGHPAHALSSASQDETHR